MKKLVIALVASFFVLCANAQISPYRQFSPFDRPHFLIEGGATYSTITAKHTDYKIGFRAGISGDFPLFFSWVSFLPSLTFESKGFIKNAKVDLAEETTDMTSMYVEVPIDFALNIPFSRKCGMQIMAGPYVGYGVAGNYAVTSDNNTALYGLRTMEYKAFFNDEEKLNLLKNFDFGIDCGIRLIFSYVTVKVNAEFGCMNMSAIETAPAFRNRSFSASAGLRF